MTQKGAIAYNEIFGGFAAIPIFMRSKLQLALTVMTRVAQAMITWSERFNAHAFAGKKLISIRLLNRVIHTLEQAGLIAETAGHAGCYILAKSPDQIQVKRILDVMTEDGVRPETLGIHTLDQPVVFALTKVNEGLEGSLDQLTLRDLVADQG